MTIVGIDLGTTNSVVAAVGDYEDKGVVYGRGQQKVTVMEDDAGRLIQASAICYDNEVGDLIVGDDAKDMAIRGYAPVRFVKKYMGTQEEFRVGDEVWSPQQVSAKILERMVAIVEQALGEKPTGAFVTHPAYFDALAINATREAAKIAGLDVEGGLMMEPIGAAMAYTQDDDRHQIRVLVYDLGGGTFDITLVDRTSGSFKPLAFGGNRELGGYNFDKKIATKMLEELRGKGFQIPIDSNHPERDIRWASLMHYAEQVKCELSKQKKSVMRKSSIFTDGSTPPKSVQLNFSMTRDEFNELIADEIQETIDATREVLQKANIEAENVDHLVLVGGSSRIPVIHEKLKEEFGLEPEYDEDVLDLSVAAGAAMAAATAGTVEGGVLLDHIPDLVDLPSVNVSGKVLPSEELSDPANCVVTIEGGSEDETVTSTGPDGSFFAKVELYEDDDNDLTIRIEAPDGTLLLERQVTVKHDAQAAAPAEKPPVPLPKPIAVDTEKGLFQLAEENAILPCRRSQPFRTIEELSELPIHIYQEDVQLSEVRIKGFSPPAPPNSRVVITLDIGEDYAMKVTVELPELNISKEEDIKLSPPVIPEIDELRQEYNRRKAEYAGRMANMPAGDAKALVAAECGRLIEQLDELLGEEHPERMQIYMLLRKLHLAMCKITEGLHPPKATVEEHLKEARGFLPEAEEKQPAFREQKTGETLDLLEQSAMTAWQQGDQEAWGLAAKRIESLRDDLCSAVVGQMKLSDFPDPPVLRMILEEQIDDLEREVKTNSQLTADQKQDAQQKLQEARKQIREVDPTGGDQSKGRIISIAQQFIGPVARMTKSSVGDKIPGGRGVITAE